MSRHANNLKGLEFGRWRVLHFSGFEIRGSKKRAMWKCRCECGTTKDVLAFTLTNGQSRSCGCLKNELTSKRSKKNIKHGHARGGRTSPTFVSWASMLDRCFNKNSGIYRHYGGRGITVCDRWRESFRAFLEDMGKRPSLQHTLERKENDGNYEPSNCRWATKTEQARNKRSSRRLTLNGVTLTLSEWAHKLGCDPSAISLRLIRGWSLERALTAKPDYHRRKNNRMLKLDGKELTLSEWAEKTGLTKFCISERLKRGWSVRRALTAPV